jgi:hypothetical protein
MLTDGPDRLILLLIVAALPVIGLAESVTTPFSPFRCRQNVVI